MRCFVVLIHLVMQVGASHADRTWQCISAPECVSVSNLRPIIMSAAHAVPRLWRCVAWSWLG